MEFDENNAPIQEQDGDYVEIYSKRAIWGFSIIPMPLFGGILLSINLWAAGYKKAIYGVMIFSFLYTVATELLVNWAIGYYNINIPLNYKMDDNAINERLLLLSAGSLVLNIIGGGVLAQYFFKKYFPEDDYYPKSIIAPLLVAVGLILFGRYFGV